MKIFLCLTQDPNIAMPICRNKGATKKAYRKTVHDKVFKFLATKVTFIKQIVVLLKQSTSHQSVHWNVWSMTKKSFCFKNPFLAKNAIFSKIMSQSKDFFNPYISKHISRNGGATIKDSQKTAHDKRFFLFWGKKAIFSQKWWHHQKNVIALNMYIGTNVLVCERWLVLKVRYMASRPNAFAIP